MEFVPHEARRIEIIGTIGHGGFGRVYLAHLHGRAGFTQRVAVKVLTDSARNQPELVGRLRDEARLLALLDHPNIVRVHDLAEHDGHPAVLMEYVSGLDLQTLVAEGGPLPLRAAVEVCEAVASALVHAWSFESPLTGRPLRVVHRDIKPSNILVALHGQVKVLDFGIARADFDREGQTKDERFGTPDFQPPEFYLQGSTGPPHDIFALGLTLARIVSAVPHGRWPAGDQAFVRAHAGWRERLELDLGQGRPQQRVLNMVVAMTRYDPTRRPSAAQVMQWSREASPELPGPGLVEIATGRVAPAVKRRHRAISEALAEVSSARSQPPQPTPADHDTTQQLGESPSLASTCAMVDHRSAHTPRRFLPVLIATATALAVLAVGLAAVGMAFKQHEDVARALPPSAGPALVISTTAVKDSTRAAVPISSSPAVDRPHSLSRTSTPDGSSPLPKEQPQSGNAKVTKSIPTPPSATPERLPVLDASPIAEPPFRSTADDGPELTTAQVRYLCAARGDVTVDGYGTLEIPATFNLPVGRASVVRMRIEQDGQTFEAKSFSLISDATPAIYRCSWVGESLTIVRD